MGVLKLIIAGLSLVSAQNLRGSNTSLSFLEHKKCGGNKNRCTCGSTRGCCPGCCSNCGSCDKTGCCGCKCCGCCTKAGTPVGEIDLEGLFVNTELPDKDQIPSCFRAFDANVDTDILNEDVLPGHICHGGRGSPVADILYVRADAEAADKEQVYGTYGALIYKDTEGNDVNLRTALFSLCAAGAVKESHINDWFKRDAIAPAHCTLENIVTADNWNAQQNRNGIYVFFGNNEPGTNYYIKHKDATQAKIDAVFPFHG